MSEPNWVSVEDLILIAREVTAAAGEPFLIRDESPLDLAVAAPKEQFAQGGGHDLVELGFDLALAVISHQPFGTANERIGWHAMTTFLAINSYALESQD